MSALEFDRWGQYYELSPFGPFRLDIGFAMVAATVEAYMSTGDKGIDIPKFLRAMHPNQKETRAQTPEEMERFLKRLATNRGG